MKASVAVQVASAINVRVICFQTIRCLPYSLIRTTPECLELLPVAVVYNRALRSTRRRPKLLPPFSLRRFSSGVFSAKTPHATVASPGFL